MRLLLSEDFPPRFPTLCQGIEGEFLRLWHKISISASNRRIESIRGIHRHIYFVGIRVSKFHLFIEPAT